MYSAPSSEGVLYLIHSPESTMTAWPALIVIVPVWVSTKSVSFKTIVYSTNPGVCAGSIQPAGLFILAMLTCFVLLFASPTNSSINLGLFPADSIRVGFSIILIIIAPNF